MPGKVRVISPEGVVIKVPWKRPAERSKTMVATGIEAYTKCIKCGKTIAVTRQFISDAGFSYKTENTEYRYIDKWGYARNFCRTCMK